MILVQCSQPYSSKRDLFADMRCPGGVFRRLGDLQPDHAAGKPTVFVVDGKMSIQPKPDPRTAALDPQRVPGVAFEPFAVPMLHDPRITQRSAVRRRNETVTSAPGNVAI